MSLHAWAHRKRVKAHPCAGDPVDNLHRRRRKSLCDEGYTPDVAGKEFVRRLDRSRDRQPGTERMDNRRSALGITPEGIWEWTLICFAAVPARATLQIMNFDRQLHGRQSERRGSERRRQNQQLSAHTPAGFYWDLPRQTCYDRAGLGFR